VKGSAVRPAGIRRRLASASSPRSKIHDLQSTIYDLRSTI